MISYRNLNEHILLLDNLLLALPATCLGVVLIILVWAGEQGMVDEAQKALEEAEALKKVWISGFYILSFLCSL